MEVRDLVLKSLEAARQEKFIGAPLEAAVHLAADDGLYSLLKKHAAELPSLFIVSQVSIDKHSEKVLSVDVSRAEGVKCARCWKYTSDVGSVAELPSVCAPCAATVAEMLGN
jgi:isoleucyl-tRNA synthetase